MGAEGWCSIGFITHYIGWVWGAEGVLVFLVFCRVGNWGPEGSTTSVLYLTLRGGVPGRDGNIIFIHIRYISFISIKIFSFHKCFI